MNSVQVCRNKVDQLFEVQFSRLKKVKRDKDLRLFFTGEVTSAQ